MGLDLTMYKKKQYEEMSDWYKKDEERRQKENSIEIHSFKGELEELAYGRKTWLIYHHFSEHKDSKEISDCVYEISKESYTELCKKSLPYEFYLKALYESSDETDLDEQIAEYICNKVFGDDSTQLGCIWECHALYKWVIENRDQIIKAFDEGPVVIEASY